MSDKPELYMQPKELSDEMCSRFGLCLSVAYICAIRRESIRRGETVFIAKEARASELFDWLKKNPRFSKNAQYRVPRLLST